MKDKRPFAPLFWPLLAVLAGAGYYAVLTNFVDPVTHFAKEPWLFVIYGVGLALVVLAGLALFLIGPRGIAALRVKSIWLAVLFCLAGFAGIAYGSFLLAFGVSSLNIFTLVYGVLYILYGVWMLLIGALFVMQKTPSPTKGPFLGFWAVMPFCAQAAVRVLRQPSSLQRVMPSVRLFAALAVIIWLACLVRSFYIVLHQKRMRNLYLSGCAVFLLATCMEFVQSMYLLVNGSLGFMPLLEALNMGLVGLAAGGLSFWIALCSNRPVARAVREEDELSEIAALSQQGESADAIWPYSSDEAAAQALPEVGVPVPVQQPAAKVSSELLYSTGVIQLLDPDAKPPEALPPLEQPEEVPPEQAAPFNSWAQQLAGEEECPSVAEALLPTGVLLPQPPADAQVPQETGGWSPVPEPAEEESPARETAPQEEMVGETEAAPQETAAETPPETEAPPAFPSELLAEGLSPLPAVPAQTAAPPQAGTASVQEAAEIEISRDTLPLEAMSPLPLAEGEEPATLRQIPPLPEPPPPPDEEPKPAQPLSEAEVKAALDSAVLLAGAADIDTEVDFILAGLSQEYPKEEAPASAERPVKHKKLFRRE